MSLKDNVLLVKFKDFFERLLALRITPAERLQYAKDPYNIFSDDVSDRRPMQVATTLAVLFHIILFILTFPAWRDQLFIPTEQVVMLKNLAEPSAPAGGSETLKAAPPKPVPTVPKPQPILVPIPDPTPLAPEPIRMKELEAPEVVEKLEDLNIGDITAPPGPPGRGNSDGANRGAGTGSREGPGPGGGGDGPVGLGDPGVVNPVLIVKTTPSYTDEAIKAKVQGVVYLQAIIRKDGSVDSFKVLRGLGYGLEEKGIQEIANKWRFRPGTLNGRPVDVQAYIEIQFNLR